MAVFRHHTVHITYECGIGEVGNFVTCTVSEFVSALFVDMSSQLTIFISKKFLLSVTVAVVEAAIGSVEIQRERDSLSAG